MIHKILFAYDGSESAQQAFDFSVDMAKRYGAALHVLAVVQPPDFAEEVEGVAVIENSRRHYEKLMRTLKIKLAQEPITSETDVVVGHPADRIIRYAAQHGVDHIVVGHRGRSLFNSLLLGSVSRQIIAHAPCAVTVVRRSA
jgi:nucleotide-binding universal stress UspA family protein